MVTTNGIKIFKPDLDLDERGIIVTGYVATESLEFLKTDDYQRELLSDVKISRLMGAFRDSRVPSIELGMRGGESLIDTTSENVYVLKAPTFIIDGFQRTSAARRLIDTDPVANPKLHATIHLNTDFHWERKRFEVLNSHQTRVNGNVMLRNMRHDLDVMDMLCKLSDSKTFILGGYVSWDQNMSRGKLVSGVTLAKTVGMLHSHIGPGRSSNVNELGRGLEKIMANAGKNIMAQNIKQFFEIVNECWGIENVAYRSTAVQLKAGFLFALAKMFSDHTNFWNGSRLDVDQQTRRKLGQFPMNDPGVVTLTSASGGKSSDILSQLLADHVNKGRRTNRLDRRYYASGVVDETVVVEDE